MTEQGWILFLKYVDACHATKLPENQGKLPEERIQELSAMAQMVTHLEAELKEGGVLTNKVSEALLACDGNLELELQVALRVKAAKWKRADLKASSSELVVKSFKMVVEKMWVQLD